MPNKKQGILTGESLAEMDAFMVYVDCNGHIANAARRLKMNPKTLQSWAVKWNWNAKLEAVEAQAREELGDVLVGARKQRLEMFLELGTLMGEKALEHIKGVQEFESDRTAIAAAQAGHAMVNEVDRIPELLIKVATATPDELLKMKAELDVLPE